METCKSYSLYPLYLYWDSDTDGRYFRVDPTTLTKDYLNELVMSEYGVANAVESGVLYYEHFGEQGSCLGYLDNESDVALFRKRFQAQHAAKLSVRRVGSFATNRKDGGSPERLPASEPTVSIPAEQLESLIESIRKLELSLNKKESPSSHPEATARVSYADPNCKTLHEEVVCDGCYPESWSTSQPSSECCSDAGFIKGSRYKCLYCFNYDLCSECVAKGLESGTHKKYHNMIKINVPDADMNNLWARFNCSAPQAAKIKPQMEIKPDVAQSTHFNVSSSDKDVIIDIPDHSSKVFDFFSKVETEGQLAELIDDHETYQNLLHRVGGDKAKLFDAVELLLAPRSSKASASSLGASVETAREDENSIEVKISKREHVISFKLLNQGPDSVSNGLKLVFRYFEPRSTLPVKCTLHMGPHEFLKGNYKTLNFNCRGLIDNFSVLNTYQIDLVDHDDQVIYSGTSHGGPTILLRPPPMMLGIQESVYSEARDVPDLGSDSQDDDRDIISNTVTNEGSRNSELDDYDFLSDSDIEV
ncbi:LANO_0C04258g1_1 [Lachancea nothofagi CBS 11611]|uniref:LANO_0C04258g1_1 n=1 Tax=Lachancea nothofagi CBS 11611 TaxID=1266666 RepID=A0A1G4J719_9SACH|nr:LANO_0C04258g1_1 [Lachancea nothofagi CBS 11611]